MAYAHIPLSHDELDTCRSMLASDPAGAMTLMPNHHVDAFGKLGGFLYETHPDVLAAHLPISNQSFFGHTAALAREPEDAILRLMSRPEENRAIMQDFLASLTNVPVDRHATLDCVPAVATSHARIRSIDALEWIPEPPDCIGLYHAYVRGFNRDVRAHKLLLVCSGGLPRACDEFANLVADVGKKWTAAQATTSLEAWWLRKACTRARERLLARLADAFAVRVDRHDDILAHAQGHVLAKHLTNTIEHDLIVHPRTHRVRVLNGCCDTTRPFNGMLCRMHNAEGFWMFRGAAYQEGTFGSVFGGPFAPGVFPVSQCMLEASSQHSVLVSPDSSCVVVSPHPHLPLQQPQPDKTRVAKTYMCFDQAYMSRLQAMRWEPDFGHVELIPIVVGVPGT